MELEGLFENSTFAAIVGAVIGGGIAMVSGYFQRRDQDKRELRENFKHKAELVASDGSTLSADRLYGINMLDIVFCTYNVGLKANKVCAKYPKWINSEELLKSHIVYFENIGDSDINEIEIAVNNPKTNVLVKYEYLDIFAKKGLINYGVNPDWKIRKGDIFAIKIRYNEFDLIQEMFGSSLNIYFRDSKGNICRQSLFPERYKVRDPISVDQKEWRENVDISRNINYWERRLKYGRK